MFRVEAFVDDRNLPKALTALNGLTIRPATAQPVVNAEKKNGQLVASSSGSTLDLFKAHLKKKKLEAITPAEMREFMTGLGMSDNSYSNLLNRAIDAKILKKPPAALRKGRGNPYKVVMHA